ncbi:MAG: alpha/beta hydrolase [Alphaproteobacteria bacterium]|nr:MAG: alpha/beta hydrolase [Alphaproteobacteria bacterium]
MSAIPGPTSHIYFSQRLRLHYVDWGNEGKPPLLLIHGGRDHCRNWDWVAEALREDYHIIAPDLRGHGDSDWIRGGTYQTADYVYDIAQLIHQLELGPLSVIAHSMGGSIALRYAGLFPETVKEMVVMEGLGMPPKIIKERMSEPLQKRMRGWVGQMREMSARSVRKYPTLDEAVDRMQEANPHLSKEQARHLTIHGVNRNEDGSYSWKFDNYVRVFPSSGMSQAETEEVWSNITCPLLMLRGAESWASDPIADGRANHFKNARFEVIENAGHWMHHDRLDEFLRLTRAFLG